MHRCAPPLGDAHVVIRVEVSEKVEVAGGDTVREAIDDETRPLDPLERRQTPAAAGAAPPAAATAAASTAAHALPTPAEAAPHASRRPSVHRSQRLVLRSALHQCGECITRRRIRLYSGARRGFAPLLTRGRHQDLQRGGRWCGWWCRRRCGSWNGGSCSNRWRWWEQWGCNKRERKRRVRAGRETQRTWYPLSAHARLNLTIITIMSGSTAAIIEVNRISMSATHRDSGVERAFSGSGT